MTAATKDIKPNQLGGPNYPIPPLLGLGAEAGATIYGGTIVCVDANGWAINGSASTALRALGLCDKQVINTVAAGYGTAGALNVTIRTGCFMLNCTDGSISAANIGQYCYIQDDNTVSLSDNGGTRPIAGIIMPPGLGIAGLPNVDATQVPVLIGMTNPYAASTEAITAGTGALRARAVVTAVTTTYGGSTTGVLTAATNSAFAAADGVALAVGDTFHLMEGATNIQAASDAGPYVLTATGSSVAKWTAQRPDWWPTGAAITPGVAIKIGGEGSIWGGTTFTAYCAKGSTVDTTDPAFFPDEVTVQVTLTSGIATLTSVPVRSRTSSNIIPELVTASTSAGTVNYVYTANTVGQLGAVNVTIKAVAAGMTSTSASDGSTLNITVVNN
jgi:hypothetical protein